MALARPRPVSPSREHVERRSTYIALIGLFLSLFATFSTRLMRGSGEVKALDVALLGMATFRAGRMVAYDQVLGPVREPFTETRPDESGAGETTVPEGVGAKRALGELLSCPICAGTWVAAIFTYGLHLLPGPTRVLLTILSAAGAAELLDATTEALSWGGAVARRRVGSESSER
ncbi:MAG TPA: DUF1360 domain-containing protein [Chloroflexota bacterium]|jgi:hypothetical protein